ncbi:MAG TPA: hypothetical protein VFB02_19425 [Bradyrhizobium sp.]|nr:hypothetical protein [Bradyrhizobium sp.]
MKLLRAGALISPGRVILSWRQAMRYVVVLGLLAGMCASADAATVHHSNPRHHASVRRAYGAVPAFVAPPSQRFDPRFPPVLQDQTPSYNDPSKLGGA